MSRLSALREDEYLTELAEAVFAGSIDRAQTVLAEMIAVGCRSDLLLRAKQKARPLPPVPELAKPIPLPQPDADPFVLFGGPQPKPRRKAA